MAKVNETGLVTVVGKGDTHIVTFYDNGVVPTPVLLPLTDVAGSRYPNVPTPTKIDELVVNKLRKLGVVPSEVCTDAEFLRRVSLDITGTASHARRNSALFLADSASDKRERKIDELLEPAGVCRAWWATKFCDVTGNNERTMPEQEFRPAYYEQWYRWVNKRFAENMPYDKLVEGLVLATSKLAGESYEQYTSDMSSYLRKQDRARFSPSARQRCRITGRGTTCGSQTRRPCRSATPSWAFGCNAPNATSTRSINGVSRTSSSSLLSSPASISASPRKTRRPSRRCWNGSASKTPKANERRQGRSAKLAAEGKPVPIRELYIADQRQRAWPQGQRQRQEASIRKQLA